MAELAFLPGPPILQVAGLKFLSRNEAMRSLLGHLGKDSFQTFRGFKPPLVCPLVGKKKEAGCALPAGGWREEEERDQGQHGRRRHQDGRPLDCVQELLNLS